MPEQRLAYTPTEAAEALGVTRQTVHRLINDGALRRFKVGRGTRIPVSDVWNLVGFEPEAVDPPAEGDR